MTVNNVTENQACSTHNSHSWCFSIDEGKSSLSIWVPL